VLQANLFTNLLRQPTTVDENQNANEKEQKEAIPFVKQQTAEDITPEASTLVSAEVKEQTPTLSTQPQTDSMEVHKHPHHVMHKKKWNEYLLEFFMLFLAVFLGFVAENIRETIAEGHREKQFMESMLNDLRLDTAYASGCIQIIDGRISAIDSTANYFMANQNASSVPFNMVRQMKRSGWDRMFIEHTGTIDELKYSGGLRLIHNRQIVDSIESYYQQIIRFTGSGHLNYRTAQDRYWQLAENLLDFFSRNEYEQKTDTTATGKVGIHASFLNEYLNDLLQLKSSANNDRKNDVAVIAKAKNLINLIQNKYNLEDE